MLNTNTITFKGKLTNKQILIEQLDLDKEATITVLIESAYQQWGALFNQHLAGDYIIVLPLAERQLLVCLSPFSSHQLFYRADDNGFFLSDNLSCFSQGATVNTLSINQLLTGRTLYQGNHLFDGVSMLTNGQCQIWQFSPRLELVSDHTLTLQQKLNSASNQSSEPLVDNIANETFIPTQAFNQLPTLARILTEPVSALWQLNFLQQVQQHTQPDLHCQQPPIIMQGVSKTINSLSASLLKRPLMRRQSALTQINSVLYDQFQRELDDWYEPNTLDFKTWLYLSYELGVQWAQKRLIAQHYDKAIDFGFCDSAKIKHWLNQAPVEQQSLTTQPVNPLFSLSDDSIVNIFDAMQRLMYHGYKPVTEKLFNIVPPISAKLIKQHPKHSSQVESFCCLSLTLDHLARHANWSLI